MTRYVQEPTASGPGDGLAFGIFFFDSDWELDPSLTYVRESAQQ